MGVESSKIVRSNKSKALSRRQTVKPVSITVHRGPEGASSQSECLHQNGEQQGQVLGTSDREFVCGVEVYHLWDGVKWRAVLSQHVLAVFTLGELHVHETLTASMGTKGINASIRGKIKM